MTAHDLSIIIPAFNEAKRIGKTLSSIQVNVKSKRLSCEVIVVDDGSTDGTSAFAKELTDAMSYMRVLRLGKNEGKGAAVRAGMLSATGRMRLFMDADGSTDIQELDKLAPYLGQGFDVVIGSRHIAGAVIQTKQGVLREVLGSAFRLMTHLLIPLQVRDTQVGFKLFSDKAARNIFSAAHVNGWMFDVEVLSLAQQYGYRIKEVPVKWENDAGSRMTWTHMLRMAIDAVRLSPIISRFSKFCMVGILNTLVDLSIYYLLTRELWTFQDSFSIAKLLSYLAATACSFAVNRYWTFEKRGGDVSGELLRFYSTVGLGIFINVGLQYVGVSIFGMNDFTAAIVSGGITAVWGFALAKWFVFQ